MIGLGTMGLSVARTLRNHDYTVYACDTHPGVATDFAKEDSVACATPAKVATGMDVMISVVVNAAQTGAVLFGEAGAAGAMRRGSTFVMCSTVDPSWSIALEARLAQRDILYMDGLISGGAAKAASGQTTMMTSTTPRAYTAVGDMFDAVASKVYCPGDETGAGGKVKIVNQLLAGVHITAATEVMALGSREGVAAGALYKVITHNAGNSWMFRNHITHMLAGDYTPLSAVDIFVRDLGPVFDTTHASKFSSSLAATAHQMLMQASTAGYVRGDDSAMIKIFPGITLPEGQPK